MRLWRDGHLCSPEIHNKDAGWNSSMSSAANRYNSTERPGEPVQLALGRRIMILIGVHPGVDEEVVAVAGDPGIRGEGAEEETSLVLLVRRRRRPPGGGRKRTKDQGRITIAEMLGPRRCREVVSQVEKMVYSRHLLLLSST